MLKRFLKYYTPHKGLFALDMSTAVCRALFAILIPCLVRTILKYHLPEKQTTMVVTLIVWTLVLAALLGISAYINLKWGHILGTRMETDMRSELFEHLQKLSFSYYDGTKTGHIMSRISNDLFTIAEIAHHAPEDFLISVCMLIGSFGCMFYFNPTLALIALIPIPFLLIWGGCYMRRMKAGFRQVRKKIADINSSVENSIQGIREVKSYANELHEISKFDEVNSEFRCAKENMYNIMAGFHSGMMFLTESYLLVIIAGAAYLLHFDRIDYPDVIAFLIFVPLMMNPIKRLINFAEQFQQGVTSFERFVEIMDILPDIEDKPDASEFAEVVGDVNIEGLYFQYESSDKWILEDININIKAGTTVALVGESGAGKSTLVSLVPRFYEPQKGRITIDGQDIMDLKQNSLRRHIGLVQQNVFLFDSTIGDNILFGKPDASDEELIAASKNANIYDFICSLPDGFDTLVGEHGIKLSGGQKQRVSIARVFLKDPQILIFDEATSSLDTQSERLIKESMEVLCRNRTTIIIAHRLTTVRHADFTYVLRDGKVVEKGTHRKLLANKEYYYQLYKNAENAPGI